MDWNALERDTARWFADLGDEAPPKPSVIHSVTDVPVGGWGRIHGAGEGETYTFQRTGTRPWGQGIYRRMPEDGQRDGVMASIQLAAGRSPVHWATLNKAAREARQEQERDLFREWMTHAAIPDSIATLIETGGFKDDHALWIRLQAAIHDGKKIIVLGGDPGKGKTTAACYALWTMSGKLFVRGGPGGTAAYIRSSDLVELHRESLRFAAKDNAVGEARARFKHIQDVPLLVIDDYGAEAGDDKMRAFYDVLIDKRYTSGRAHLTIITTNLDQGMLAADIGERARRRIREVGHAIFVGAKKPVDDMGLNTGSADSD